MKTKKLYRFAFLDKQGNELKVENIEATKQMNNLLTAKQVAGNMLVASKMNNLTKIIVKVKYYHP